VILLCLFVLANVFQESKNRLNKKNLRDSNAVDLMNSTSLVILALDFSN